jgi:hypothetical protein
VELPASVFIGKNIIVAQEKEKRCTKDESGRDDLSWVFEWKHDYTWDVPKLRKPEEDMAGFLWIKEKIYILMEKKTSNYPVRIVLLPYYSL